MNPEKQWQSMMAGAWAQFAYTGNPNRVRLPTWEEYTPENKAYLVCGDQTVLTHGHDCGLRCIEEVPAEKRKTTLMLSLING